jgi:predicted nucleotidyltransferase
MNAQAFRPGLPQAEMIDMIRNRLPGIVAIYLFGSRAAEAAGTESDLDLAVLAEDPLSAVEVWELAQQLAISTGCDVDLVDLRTASTVMRMQVIAHGQRIFCTDDWSCDSFEDFVFADHARLNEERAAILEDVRQRRSIHG